MSSAPENDIEPLLKACANKRRDDAGSSADMPAAMRRALQAEVARTIPKSAPPPAWVGLFSGFWPRLAWSCGGIALLLALAFLSLRSDKKLQSQFDLAKKTDDVKIDLAPSSAAANREQLKVQLNENPNFSLQPSAPSSPNTKDIEVAARSLALDRSIALGGGKNVSESEITLKEPSPLPSLRLVENLSRGLSTVPAPSSAPLPESLSLGRADLSAAEKQKAAVASDVKEPHSEANLAYQEKATRALTPTATKPATPEPIVATPGQSLVNVEKRSAEANRLLSLKETPASTPTPANASQAYYFQNTSAQGLNQATANGQRLFLNRADARVRLRRNYNSPPAPKVLESFQIERRGNNVIVIDADGSVYEGTAQLQARVSPQISEASKDAQAKPFVAPLTARAGPAANSNQTPDPASQTATEANFSFRAAGTNRSLNQKIIFTGNYRNSPAPSGAAGLGSGGVGAGRPVTAQTEQANLRRSGPDKNAASKSQTQLQNSLPSQLKAEPDRQLPQMFQNERIDGRASIDGTNEIPIEAVRVAP